MRRLASNDDPNRIAEFGMCNYKRSSQRRNPANHKPLLILRSRITVGNSRRCELARWFWGRSVELHWKVMAGGGIQYISDESGETTAVIVPIALWRELESERETAYLMRSETMKHRLLEARDRREGLLIETVVEKLGV
jgi:hypothetical protein